MKKDSFYSIAPLARSLLSSDSGFSINASHAMGRATSGPAWTRTRDLYIISVAL